jgi:VIT1/CCC1 family predicted Fe2+/Mn2+ transporter
MGLTAKRRGLTILRFIRMNREHGRARDFIAGELPPVIASVLTHEELENIRHRIAKKDNFPKRVAITKEDLKSGGQIFLLVFLSTLPIVIPFLIMSNARMALRISNLVAIVIMYICGWILGRYASRNPWTAGLIISLIGIGLVLLAIYLGG